MFRGKSRLIFVLVYSLTMYESSAVLNWMCAVLGNLSQFVLAIICVHMERQFRNLQIQASNKSSASANISNYFKFGCWLIMSH